MKTIFTWKNAANFAKVIVAVEMAVFFVATPDRTALDILTLCLGQYAVFAPVDVSMIIKNIKTPLSKD